MSVEYRIEHAGRAGITSLGRGVRRGQYQCVVTLPNEVKEKLDALIEGGSISSALSGLLVYAIDSLEREKARLIIKNIEDAA